MGTIYFFNGAHYGHVNPTLGPTHELVRRGHQVIYFGGETFRDAVQQTGATFRVYDQQPREESITEAEQFAASLIEYSTELLPGLIEQARVDKPECVIFDMLRPWGWLLARILALPAVCSSPSFALTPPVLRAVAPDFSSNLLCESPSAARRVYRERFAAAAAGIRKRFDVACPSIAEVLAMTGDTTLVYTTRRIQPAAHLLDNAIEFVGPSLHRRFDFLDQPVHRLPKRRNVFISLGTIFNNQVEFFRNCIQAFADADYAVTMAIGHAIEVESLGELPANFTVRQFVPQMEVLKRTDVFLTHAGMGGVHEALSYGVPMVLYPQMIEQSIVARQIASLGAGAQLTSISGATSFTSTELVGAATIREAVDSVMHDARFACNARQLGREFPSDTPARVADVVGALLSETARVGVR